MGIHPRKAIPQLMFVHFKIRFQRQIRFYEHFKRFEINIIKQICYVNVFHCVETPFYGHS